MQKVCSCQNKFKLLFFYCYFVFLSIVLYFNFIYKNILKIYFAKVCFYKFLFKIFGDISYKS